MPTLIFSFYSMSISFLLIELFIEAIVGSHVVIKNNSNRFFVNFSQVPQMATFCKSIV